MRPLGRQNIDTRNQGLETRVEMLERRIIPKPGLPIAFCTANPGAQTLNGGDFVQPSFDRVIATDPNIFSHVPLVTLWNPSVNNNIDGSLIIMQRGVYAFICTMIWASGRPADTQSGQVQIATCGIADIHANPLAPAGIFGAGGIGSINAINSDALGRNITTTVQWVYNLTGAPAGFSFDPYCVKPRLILGSGSSRDISSWQMECIQLAPAQCIDVLHPYDITDLGIPDDWEDANPC